MNKVLIKYSGNWADEMDMDGFCIMEADKWEETKTKIASIEGEFSIYWGSNEEEETTADEMLRNLEVEPITKEQAEVIEHFFPECTSDYGYGDCPVYNLLDIYNERLEEAD